MAAIKDVGMQIKMNVKCFKDIILLEKGQKIDEKQILDLVDFVNARHDCADFRLICLIMTRLRYASLLSKSTLEAIDQAMLSFKYWMDEPGIDGMCYWSENHQLLFAACEFLSGKTFPNQIFLNNQMKGIEHAAKAKVKILRWLEYRYKYGFTEWHSNTYYEEDIAPLCVLIDFSFDEEIIQKAKIILDLLFLDMAMHSYQGYFVATSGRCYEKQKIDSTQADVNDILSHAFGIIKRDYDYERISSMYLLCHNYRVPEVIKRIAKAKGTFLIKDSMGLDLSEVRDEIPNDDFDDRGMFLWAMEAFTNPESINLTMDIFNAWNLRENNFLKDLKMISHPILRKSGFLPMLVKILNPATQGVAIERANTLTYKTDDFMLSTAQSYHPGSFGDQQHLWQATLPNRINVFSTHPGSPMFDDDARNFSPSYWVGNGIHPHVVQDNSIVMMIYNLKHRKGFLEKSRQKFVHFHFPISKFEEVLQDKKAIFGAVNETYIAILFSHSYEIKNNNELICYANHCGFTVVLGSKTIHHSFKSFIEQLRQAEFHFNRNQLSFKFDKHYHLIYRRGLMIDGLKINTEYKRFDTPFVVSKRKPEIIKITHDGLSLTLDFYQGKRIYSNKEVGVNEK